MSIGTTLSELLESRGIKAIELARQAGVPPSTVYSILERNNERVHLDALHRMAIVLGVTLDYFTKDYESEEDDTPEYYLNAETKAIAQDIYDNPDLRILFDASRKATPESLKKIAQMVQIMKGEDDEPV
jgi:transcriptional regulator with XRE-family HTH domain